MRLFLIALTTLFLDSPSRAHPVDSALPLGDGKVSATPRAGYVMACQTRFGGGGAFRAGGWIGDGTWDPAGKPVVAGAVAWPNAAISVTVEGDRRVLRANNLPAHATGEFPIRPGTEAFNYDRNPNRIAEQTILISLPASPAAAAQPGCVPMGMIGFALSGAAIFNAFDAGGRDAPAYEIQDRCNGHPEMRGQYHYHNWSPCLAARNPAAPVGWMLDGFPILGPVDSDGRQITNAELDDCHGRVGKVSIDGKVVTIYHYHFTREFPYTIGCFKGVVDAAWLRPQRGPPPGMAPPGRSPLNSGTGDFRPE